MINERDNKSKNNTGYVEIETYIDGKLVGKEKKQLKKMDEVEEVYVESLGIGFITPYYIEVNESQDKLFEYRKIEKFLKKYMVQYATRRGIDLKDLTLEFINYGKTELVYVLTEKNGERVTILTKQPAVEFGKIKQEAINLIKLKEVDDRIVAPIDYYCFDDQELYVTPYINQARCVASDTTWGMYVPEPFYRFESFNKNQEHVVNSSMIAILVSLYDFKANQGIASCKLGGGDFMLKKGWENAPLTIENTLNNLYLIAAREMVDCSFEEYLNIVREEFSRTTINENQKELLLNHRARVAMEISDIENGIKLAKEIISKRNQTSNKKR